MNSRKYKDNFYKVREIRDLRELIKGSVEKRKSYPAFLVKDTSGGEYKPISYSKFDADIDGLGTSLIDMGLLESKIAIIGENSYEWVVAYLAVTNGTGVVVPIDRELHPKEIAHLIKRSGANVIVHSTKMKKSVDEVLAYVRNVEYVIDMAAADDTEDRLSMMKLIEKGNRLMAAGDRRFTDAEIDPDVMCALLFTSGTTGMAKGVMLSHKNIAANVYNMSQYVDIIEEGVGLSVLPMHHTYELTCHIFTGLYQAITLAICEGLKHIQKNMVESRATVMLSVPLIFETMHKKIWKKLEANGSAGKARRMISISKKLKLYNHDKLIRRIFKELHDQTGGRMVQFIAGGAAIDPRVIEDYEAMGIPMIQGYGMTENSPIIAVNRDCYSKAASVGQPMPNTEVRIIDPDENGMGEIICKGPSVMLGYYNDPVATKETIKNGWLYTGDYGYMDEEGYLYISGRKKNVIVTKNGKNVFPEEVEFCLTESQYIQEALVHGIEDERTGDIIIKAEIFPDYEHISEQKGDIDEDGLRELLKIVIDDINEEMPLYKRVRRFGIRKEEFSKTTTRKIKRYNAENKSSEGQEDVKC